MEYKNLIAIIDELKRFAEEVKQEDIDRATEFILKAKNIFVAGAGRSGCAARGFVIRLLHLGFPVHFVGECSAPPIKKGDLLVIGSGSGRTTQLVTYAQKAKAVGAEILTVTISPQNTIGQMADAIITLPGTTRLNDAATNKKSGSIQPVGSMFEQLSFLTYDALVLTLMEKTKQTNDDLISRHANLE